ncbi:MAG: hypothetical protein D3920_13955, partial [Candidatus Electrothrix sp. AW2]|nr:hypothetical protein [Candidatus Electrothrix gigas]
TPAHPSVLDLSYVYDRVGNVTQKSLQHLGLSESYVYDARYQLVKVTDETGIETVSYDALGNIASINNPNFSAKYKYGNACGDAGLSGYQLCQIIRQEQGNPTDIVKNYQYDKSGRVIDDGARKISYGLNGKPEHVTSAAAEISFEYGPENQRITRIDRSGSKISKILYVGDSFEVLSSDDRKILRHYVDGYLHVDIEEDQKKETYLHRDLLGSVVSLTDADSNLIQTQNFTVWGERKDTEVASDLTPLDQNSLRGYTNHEMLDSIGLIHMNGRVYDPAARRFISPDPFIQDISESISFNRYAYAWNNPASGIDPSGYFFKDIAKAAERFGDWISDSNNQRQLIATAAVIVASIYVPTIAASYGQFAAYAYVGTVNYAGTYYATNGNHDASMRSAATSMAFYGVGSAFDSQGVQDNLGYKEGNPAAAYGVSKAAAHGMVGGASSVASGGKFEHGFLSASVSSAFSTYGGYEAIGATNQPSGVADYAWNAGAAAIVGGTISQISGGSFEEGATTAAYGRLFNDNAHDLVDFLRHDDGFRQLERKLKEMFGDRYSTIGEPYKPNAFHKAGQAFTVFLIEVTPAGGVERVIIGRDPHTLKQLSIEERFVEAGKEILPLGIGKAAKYCKGVSELYKSISMYSKSAERTGIIYNGAYRFGKAAERGTDYYFKGEDIYDAREAYGW